MFLRTAGGGLVGYNWGVGFLGPVNTNQRIRDERKVDEEHENNIQFIESREDTAKSFQSTKQPFYFISFLIHLFIVFPRCQSIRFRRNNRNHFKLQYQLQRLIAFIESDSFVGVIEQTGRITSHQ